MTPEDYARVRALFDAAVDLPPAERLAYVDASTLDASLREEVLALLARHQDSASLDSTRADSGQSSSGGDGALSNQQLGSYRLLRELGGGGMGIVYLAVRNDDVFHKTVAVKIIRAGVVQSEYLERFRRERQILAGLDHPNIARILDGGDTRDGRPFYVMEYVAGLPLDEHCQRVGADVETRLRLMLQVCDAVEYLHDNAIVHRDLKPGNILVTTDGRAKVLDLGIAGVQTPEGLVGSPGPAGGRTRLLTPGFASPEQIEGSVASKTSDVYSLGVVLYHLLTGRLPFVNATGEPDLAKQLSETDPAPPSAAAAERASARTAISPDLDRVVLNALRRDPTRRYDSVRKFREDLERVLDGRPVSAHAPTWSYRTGKAVRRNKLLTALAASLMLAFGSASCLAIQWRVNQARLDVKETDFDKILQALDDQMEGWSKTAKEVPTAEKTAVVQRAADLLKDEKLKKVAARGDKPQLVNHVVSGVERVLSRAEQLAGDAPSVHKDVSVAYRLVGDFRLVVATTSGGRRDDAVRSYQHAAEAAREVARSDSAWAHAALQDLAARLGSLGTRLDVTVYLQPAQSAEAGEAARIKPPEPVTPRPAAPRVVPPGAVDEALRRELLRELEATSTTARRGRASAAALSAQLEARGQTLRADVNSQFVQVDMFLDQARDDLTVGELEAARENLTKANYVLRRVKSSIGS